MNYPICILLGLPNQFRNLNRLTPSLDFVQNKLYSNCMVIGSGISNHTLFPHNNVTNRHAYLIERGRRLLLTLELFGLAC